MGEQKFKKPGEEDDNDFDAGFKIPDTKSFLAKSEAGGLAFEHTQQQEAEDEEDKKKGKPKRKKKQSTAICCCGSPHCRIGPFTETESRSSDE